MKTRVVVFILVSFSLLTTGFPIIPEKFSGVAYVDGGMAEKGVEVKVVSESGLDFSTTVYETPDGGLRFNLNVYFDDPETANVIEGVSEGEELIWYVGGREAVLSGGGKTLAQSGGYFRDLVVLAGSGGGEVVETTVASKSTLLVQPETPLAGSTSTVSAGGQESTLSSGGASESTIVSGSVVPKNVTPLSTPASCRDGVRNNGEEGVDCGGSCGPCGGRTGNLLLVSAAGFAVLFVFFILALAILFVFLKHRGRG